MKILHLLEKDNCNVFSEKLKIIDDSTYKKINPSGSKPGSIYDFQAWFYQMIFKIFLFVLLFLSYLLIFFFCLKVVFMAKLMALQ